MIAKNPSCSTAGRLSSASNTRFLLGEKERRLKLGPLGIDMMMIERDELSSLKRRYLLNRNFLNRRDFANFNL